MMARYVRSPNAVVFVEICSYLRPHVVPPTGKATTIKSLEWTLGHKDFPLKSKAFPDMNAPNNGSLKTKNEVR
jgi:hypothetical protein